MLSGVVCFYEFSEFYEFFVIAHIKLAHIFYLGNFTFFDVIDLCGAPFTVNECNYVHILVRTNFTHFFLVFHAKRVKIIVGIKEHGNSPFFYSSFRFSGSCISRNGGEKEQYCQNYTRYSFHHVLPELYRTYLSLITLRLLL